MQAKTAVYRIFFPQFQTARATYFQKKFQLPEFSVYPDCRLSQLIRIIEVLLYI
jgi:hypothetical protein